MVLSSVRLFVTPWTLAHQVPLSMEFSRQEYWNGLPFPTPGNLLNPGIEPTVSCVSCIGRWILYHWATREFHIRLFLNAPQILDDFKTSVRKTHQWIIRDSGLYAALKVVDVGYGSVGVPFE